MKQSADLLNERQGTHGAFVENALIAQSLKGTFRTSPGYKVLTPIQREALDLIATKISRVLSGNSGFDDHWQDIQGYAQLAREEIFANGMAEQIAPEETLPLE